MIRTLSVIAASVFAIGCASSVAQTAFAQTPAPTAAMPGPSTTAPAAAPAAAAPAAAALGPDGLPTGPGHELVMRVCTACHGTEMFTEKRMDRNGWDDTVQMMAGRGAQATPDEFKAITDYLAVALPAA